MSSQVRHPAAYILASKKNGTLYTGVTNDLELRMQQHKSGTIPGFAARYKVSRLVWYETYPDMLAAIGREKRLKKWNRAWKIRLIEETNPEWNDLSENWFE